MYSHSKRETRSIFPFLTLPAELRIAIYEAAFIAPCEIDASYSTPSTQPGLVPGAFLRTCRQVYHEAHKILYSRNTFCVGQGSSTLARGSTWLSNIGKHNAGLLKSVSVQMDYVSSTTEAFALINFLMELRRSASILELSLWLVEINHSLIGRGGPFFIELCRFQNLQRVVFGGECPNMWRDSLQETIRIFNTDIKFEFVPYNSPTWLEREKEMAWWRKHHRRLQTQRRILAWKAAKEHDLSEWASATTPLRRDAHACDACMWLWRGRVAERQDRLLNVFAKKEQMMWTRTCKCTDCRLAYQNWLGKQRGRFFVDVQANESDSSLDTTLRSQSAPMQNDLQQNVYDDEVDGVSFDEVGMTIPAFSKLGFEDPCKCGNRRAKSKAHFSNSTTGKSTLRRENRKWYKSAGLRQLYDNKLS